MYFPDSPPAVIDAVVWTQMPAELRRPGIRSAWSDANKGGLPIDSFIEGPSFDSEGRLWLVDIPHGRILHVDSERRWSVAAEYDGEPNGLAWHPDLGLLIADYRRGLMRLDPATGRVNAMLERRNGESFKGLNDLVVSSTGDIYFTDQGQTGLHDPSGRVFRLDSDGRLDCLIDNVPSPNGLVLGLDERVLYLAVTRDNSIWRIPLQPDGGISKVGRFASMFGTSGPDGLALDREGSIACAHASLGCVLLFAAHGELLTRVRTPTGPTCTNAAYGLADPKRLFITESSSGSVLVADLDVPGMDVPRGGFHRDPSANADTTRSRGPVPPETDLSPTSGTTSGESS